jgi:hypothetical protein
MSNWQQSYRNNIAETFARETRPLIDSEKLPLYLHHLRRFETNRIIHCNRGALAVVLAFGEGTKAARYRHLFDR